MDTKETPKFSVGDKVYLDAETLLNSGEIKVIKGDLNDAISMLRKVNDHAEYCNIFSYTEKQCNCFYDKITAWLEDYS
jgi:hypothetical protein